MILALAAAAGALLGLAAPPFDFYPALWIGMSGLAGCLARDPSWPPFASRSRVALTGARRGLAFGAAANIVALRFVPQVVARFTPLPWIVGVLALILLAAFEASRWCVAAVACETLIRARVPRPIAFAAGVYGGTFVPTMLPWTVAGGVSPWSTMVQLADVVGERGVAALMALAAGLAAEGVRASLTRPTRTRGACLVAAAAALVSAQAFAGAARMRTIERESARARHARVALVQPSIPATTRWEDARAPAILEALTALTRAAEDEGADLVVWPEAAYPYRLPHGSRAQPAGARAVVQAGVHRPVITGLLTLGPGETAFNSVVLATRDGLLSEPYDKRHLLWFGETVPFADHIAFLRRIFARAFGLAPGDREVAFAVGPIRAAALVCYEDTLPESTREAAQVHPNLLVNVTNDAWFTGTIENELHLRMAALRAIELRRDLVRAVNLGPPSWFDAAGRLRGRGPSDLPGVLESDPALLDLPETPYARFGDSPWALAALLFANVAVWRASRNR